MTAIRVEKVNCPLCGSHRQQHCFTVTDQLYCRYKDELKIVRCRECGMGYISPRPTEESIKLFYPEAFYKQNHNDSSQAGRTHGKYQWIEDLPQGRLLDIGCAGGDFAHYARQRGWQAEGYEWSDLPENYYNIPIKTAPSLEGLYSERYFDVVTSWAVLEHVYHPLEMLKEMSRILKPGGRLVLLVTNFNSIPARLTRADDFPRHTNLFTKPSLSKALRQNRLTPQRWSFDNKIFSSSHRGSLVFLYKMLRGEKIHDIRGQHKSPGRRPEFCTVLHGRYSAFVDALCVFDRTIAPIADWLAQALQVGHIMTVSCIKR